MSSRFRLPTETDDVYCALVGELATSVLPTAIMVCTFVGIAGYITASQPSAFLVTTTIVGGALGFAKLALMTRQRRVSNRGTWSRARSARWESAHAALTIGFAVQVGSVTARTFLYAEPALQMLATGMLFGYCSGVAARVSFRPMISAAAMAAAAVPACFGAGLRGDMTGLVLAVVFAVFLLGGLETVRYLYGVASRHIAMTLDMATLARHDPLTGLYNRLGLREAFRARMAEPRSGLVAVHCLDLDGFKPVNDQHGHATGDQLLSAVARRLYGLVGTNGIVSRLGGDEFVVVQIPVADSEQANTFAHQLCRAIRAPFQVGGVEIRLGASVGYTTSASETRDLEPLIAKADEALYRAKRTGGDTAVQQATLAA